MQQIGAASEEIAHRANLWPTWGAVHAIKRSRGRRVRGGGVEKAWRNMDIVTRLPGCDVL